MSASKTTTVKYLEVPVKPLNDNKYYKTLLLPNGLKVLLISEPLSDIDLKEQCDDNYAAVTLMVDAGSFCDPYKYHGLANFVSNMICMGSKKYPTEFAFYNQVELLLGDNSDFTEPKENFYVFEISTKHLDECLDYFVDQFREPILSKEVMIRTRDSFDTELPINVLIFDDEKHSQLLCHLSNQDDPFNILENYYIDDDDLHNELLDFYQRYYSAHRMYVCMQAGMPLDELESLAIKHFSPIPSNDLPGKDFSMHDYRHVFNSQFHEEVLLVKSEENVYKLDLTWILPPIENLNNCKPESFLSYLFKQKGEGSLYAYLYKKLWATNVDSYAASNPICTFFKLYINLTLSGFEHLDDVIQAVFNYIQLLSQPESLKATYEELSEIKSNNFRFIPNSITFRAFDNSRVLAENFKYYSANDILAGPQLFYQYDKNHIKKVFKHFREFNFNITITSSQKYNDDIKYDKKEKYYLTEYTSIKMPAKWHSFWYNLELLPELYLPEPNNFVSKDFRILWLENNKPPIPLAPKLLIKSDLYELWFRQDDKFLLPKAHMNFYFISPLLRQSPKNAVLCDLYVKLILMHLSEKLYPATVAGLQYTFESAEKGVILKVNGYNEKLHLIVEHFSKAIAFISDHITEFQLTVAKNDLRKKSYTDFSSSEVLNNDIHSAIMKNIYWSVDEKCKCLNKITLCDIMDFASKFRRELYVKCLIQGNVNEDMSKNVLYFVVNIINCQKIKETYFIEDRGVELSKGSNFIKCNNIKTTATNTVVKNFYQIGCRSMRIEAILAFIMETISSPFIDTIRSKDNLSFTHSLGIGLYYDIIGYFLTVTVEANKFEAKYVEERIEAFNNNILQILQDITQDQLDKFRNNVIKSKQILDKTLQDEVNRNWEEIQRADYMFDRRNKEIEILTDLKKSDIVDFWLQHKGLNQRKLSVQVIGSKIKFNFFNRTEEVLEELLNQYDFIFIPKDGKSKRERVVNLNDFKENLNVYPIKKTAWSMEQVKY